MKPLYRFGPYKVDATDITVFAMVFSIVPGQSMYPIPRVISILDADLRFHMFGKVRSMA
jgi:hypothetical protein